MLVHLVNQMRTANDSVLVAHNEDWLPEDEPDVFIIRARPDDPAGSAPR